MEGTTWQLSPHQLPQGRLSRVSTAVLWAASGVLAASEVQRCRAALSGPGALQRGLLSTPRGPERITAAPHSRRWCPIRSPRCTVAGRCRNGASARAHTSQVGVRHAFRRPQREEPTGERNSLLPVSKVPVRDTPYQPLDIVVARSPKPDRSAHSERGAWGAPRTLHLAVTGHEVSAVIGRPHR